MAALPDNDEVRRINLRRIVERFGVAVVCERLPCRHTQLIAYIGARPSRNIGREFARRVEETFELEPNWLDHLHQDQSDRLHVFLSYAGSLQDDKFKQLAEQIEAEIARIEAKLVRDGVDPDQLLKQYAPRGVQQEKQPAAATNGKNKRARPDDAPNGNPSPNGGPT